jgi:hypothetical protein
MPEIKLRLEDRLKYLLKDLLGFLFRLVIGDQVQTGLTGSSSVDVQVKPLGPIDQLLAGIDPHRAAVHHGHGSPGGMAQTLGLANGAGRALPGKPDTGSALNGGGARRMGASQ